MTQSSSTFDLAAAVEDPAKAFSHPREVVAHSEILKRDKVAILESWLALEEAKANLHTDDEHIDGPRLISALTAALDELR